MVDLHGLRRGESELIFGAALAGLGPPPSQGLAGVLGEHADWSGRTRTTCLHPGEPAECRKPPASPKLGRRAAVADLGSQRCRISIVKVRSSVRPLVVVIRLVTL
ncbi:hypothetical protein NSI01_18400 [Pimelobacter simplex]|nr:hypothetical protein NSI01_18400 [Pimelobacter simplex]